MQDNNNNIEPKRFKQVKVKLQLTPKLFRTEHFFLGGGGEGEQFYVYIHNINRLPSS